ncbi:MAG: PTS sugar transporter subunit IIA [Candidatus Latescibacterota bacterium]|jgi:mannitol/fructose-specific phosphotransferase system IIA component (Ntr-type)
METVAAFGSALRDAENARPGVEICDGWLHPELLVPNLGADTKIGAIKELVDRLHRRGIVQDSLGFLQSVLERENQQSTILHDGVALPHARSRWVSELGVALGVARRPIDFPSGDDRRPVRVICLVAVPAQTRDPYLPLLATLAGTFSDQGLREALLRSTTADELHALLAARRAAGSPHWRGSAEGKEG